MRGSQKVVLTAGIAIIVTVGIAAFNIMTAKPDHKQTPSQEIPVVGSGANPEAAELHLGEAAVVAGTNAIRIELYFTKESSGFSSRGSYEIRNILFVERGEKAARWLLQDNDHEVFDISDITDGKNPNEQHVLASVATIKVAGDLTATKRLILFDPSGKNVVTIADGVTRVYLSTAGPGEVFILYERDRKLVQVAYDPKTLTKLREIEMDVPKLNPPHMQKN